MEKHRHHSRRHHHSKKNHSRRNAKNYQPIGFNYLNTPEQKIRELNFNAPDRINEVVNTTKYRFSGSRKNNKAVNIHAQERPLRLTIPATTRKQIRSIRQQQLKPAFQRITLNTIFEGNETRSPKMPKTPNPANYNLIFGKW